MLLVFGSKAQLARKTIVDGRDEGEPHPGEQACHEYLEFEHHDGAAPWDESKMGCMGMLTYEACLKHKWAEQPPMPPPAPSRFGYQATKEEYTEEVKDEPDENMAQPVGVSEAGEPPAVKGASKGAAKIEKGPGTASASAAKKEVAQPPKPPTTKAPGAKAPKAPPPDAFANLKAPSKSSSPPSTLPSAAPTTGLSNAAPATPEAETDKRESFYAPPNPASGKPRPPVPPTPESAKRVAAAKSASVQPKSAPIQLSTSASSQPSSSTIAPSNDAGVERRWTKTKTGDHQAD